MDAVDARASLLPRAPIYLSLALLTIFLGFYPSYFSVLREAPTAHHFHGLSATVWVLLLIGQATLMRLGRRELHRAAGKLSYLLAPLLVVSGLAVVQLMLSRDAPFERIFGPRLAFVDLVTLAWFAVAYGLALRHRRNVQLHARYMISTVVLVLPAALARVLGNFVLPEGMGFVVSFHGGMALAELTVLALLIDDRRHGRFLPPYPAALAVLLIAQAGFVAVPAVPGWASLCAWIGAL